ncbi:MAG: hypothetical protein AAGN82_19005 [Myxococcota bacterium]
MWRLVIAIWLLVLAAGGCSITCTLVDVSHDVDVQFRATAYQKGMYPLAVEICLDEIDRCEMLVVEDDNGRGARLGEVRVGFSLSDDEADDLSDETDLRVLVTYDNGARYLDVTRSVEVRRVEINGKGCDEEVRVALDLR